MKPMSRFSWLLGAAWMVALAAGCEGPFHVEVALDKDDAGLRDKSGNIKSCEINFVAINETEKPVWEQMSVDDYWQPGNKIRMGAQKYMRIMTFGQDRPLKQRLAKNDAMWREWLSERKATWLIVLAYIPEFRSDKVGQADPRRILLPLDVTRYEWYYWGDDVIRIELSAGGIKCLRQPKQK